MTQDVEVDLVILTRGIAPVSPVLKAAVDSQSGVRLQIFRVLGRRRPTDENRWQTIARARNTGRVLGNAPWVMYLDDDVILAEDCIRQLVSELQADPRLAAVAADYNLTASGTGFDEHVGMGATLFRRSALQQIEFRSEASACECACCARDLRAREWRIQYSPIARALHQNPRRPTRTSSPAARHPEESHGQSPAPQRPGRILAAFDRRHLRKFRRQFLPSLRRHGNHEIVTAVAYGLFPSERRRLSQLPGVEAHFLPSSGVMTPIRRLRDFQPLLARWPADTPVAYWDAGDVLFQSRLQPLWQLVAKHPQRLLACAEPKSYPDNPAVACWTLTIHDPAMRQRAFQLLSTHPFLNSGFAAGTVSVMLSYFREADRLLHSPKLFGSSDWGDQTALNLYCHSDPLRWHQIEAGWNYCLHDRLQDIAVQPNGRLISRRGAPIYVAHGNAKSMRQFELISDMQPI
ncbi:MAG TPA: hypothetical protein VFG20_18065 [Planctomycetaceae bacterium]|nr:hypothetical protein [Planctomycetaceae bacterium]